MRGIRRCLRPVQASTYGSSRYRHAIGRFPLKWQVGRAVETGVRAQQRFLDARAGEAEDERAAGDLGKHRRGKKIPGRQRAAADQVEREVENINQVCDGDSESA